MSPSRLPSTSTVFVVGALLVGACGGSGGNPGSPNPPSSPPPSSGSNPCTAALAALEPGGGVAPSAKKTGPLGHDDRDPRDVLALRHLPRGGSPGSRGRAPGVTRMGDIAVVIDDGSLVVLDNPFDLGGTGLRFSPNGAGGYDVAQASAVFRGEIGQRVTLGDDDSSDQPLSLSFSFYGAAWPSTFVNSDGNLTFGVGDSASSDRSVGRVLSGAPRVAPFFADLDPSAGGAVFVDAAPDAFTVTWCEVPGFDSSDTATVQTTLFAGGEVEVRIDGSTTLTDAVVALSPGADGGFAAVDLSAQGPTPGGGAAVGERFASDSSLDTAAASRAFYQGFSDAYDQLIFWTDTHVTDDAFAYETTINNAIVGIGQQRADFAGEFGSAGRLASTVVMDNTGKYPSSPTARIARLGEDTTLSLLAHETGHRWGATLRFQDPSGGPASDLLLGRQRAHWSFFCDSDASVLEGNDIEDLGGDSFETVAAVERYSPLDLYAMGLIGEGEVPPVFYVEDGSVPGSAGIDRETGPATGVSITGTRRDVTIAEIVAVMGARQPSASSSPRTHRQAWVYVVTQSATADPAIIDKLEGFRRAFEAFFLSATGGRMRLETSLD